MNRYLEAVKEFHVQFGHPINDVKDEIPLKVRQLRVKLIFEELQELAEASDIRHTFGQLCETFLTENQDDNLKDGNNVNKVEELDALCDIQYVLSGAIIATGHHKNFDQSFEDVQESNMSKLCANENDIASTQGKYLSEGVSSHVEPRGDKFVVLRDGDDKVLKNVNYKAVDLSKYV